MSIFQWLTWIKWMRKSGEGQVHLVLTFTNVWLDDIFFVCSSVA